MKRAAPLTQDAIQERGAELRRAEGAGDLAGAVPSAYAAAL